MDIEKGVLMKNTKVIFMGTASFAIPLLEALIENCTVMLIITQPDKQINGNKVSVPPVKEIALKHNIQVIQPENVNDQFVMIQNLAPDIIITCAYGQILSQQILSIPRLGCINIHASLLPKLRGGAPIQRAIMNGYYKTGVTIAYMTSKLDAGDIISQVETRISNEDNAGTLHDRLSILARELLLKTLPNIISGNVTRVKQNNNEATYAWNIERKDEKIDFSKTRREVFNQIRGLNPWPGAYSVLEGKIYKIWNARVGKNGYIDRFNGEIINLYEDGIGVRVNNGEIIITEIQVEGKNRMSVRDYLNGLQDKERLIGKIFE